MYVQYVRAYIFMYNVCMRREWAKPFTSAANLVRVTLHKRQLLTNRII